MTKAQPTNEAFDRFRELARRVIAVPKAAADARAQLRKAPPRALKKRV